MLVLQSRRKLIRRKRRGTNSVHQTHEPTLTRAPKPGAAEYGLEIIGVVRPLKPAIREAELCPVPQLRQRHPRAQRPALPIIGIARRRRDTTSAPRNHAPPMTIRRDGGFIQPQIWHGRNILETKPRTPLRQ